MDCDFEFVTKSNYADLHKSKPVKFANIEGLRQNRKEERSKQRRSSRYDKFVSNRVIIDDGMPLSPYSEVQSPVPPTTAKQSAMERKKQLQQWLAEKKKRRADLVKSKVKPFIVPVVHSTLAYKAPSPITKQAKQMSVVVSDRITRSRRDANKPSRPIIVKPVVTKPKILKNMVPLKIPTVMVTSFAPQNAQFHPPKVNSFPPYQLRQPDSSSNQMQDLMRNVKQHKSTAKPKPVIGHTGRILRNKLTQTSLTKPEKQSKKVKKVVNGLHNKSAERSRKSLRNEEILPAEGSHKSPRTEEVLPIVISHKSSDTGVRYMTPVKRAGVPKSESLSEEKLKTPPLKTAIDHTLSAISPFVTMSRGKDKALREKKSKIDDGMFADDVCDEKTTQHFRNQLDGEINRLRQMSKEWDDYKEANVEIIPDHYQDLLFQASCQTNLLITNKFEQFRGLIDRCENQQMVDGEGAVTLQDLQGFWDMVFIQVDDIAIRFKKLSESRAKNWAQEEVPANDGKKITVNKMKKKKGPKNTGPGRLTAMIDAARKAAAQNKSLSSEEAVRLVSPMKAFKAELLKARTSGRNTESRNSSTPARNTSMLKNVLSSELRRLSVIKSTPTSMAMLRASYISRCVTENKKIEGVLTPQAVSEVKLDATPGRSILKIPRTATKNSNRGDGKKSIKVVLFTSSDMSTPTTISIEDGIVPMEPDNDIPSITDRLEVITMNTTLEIAAKRRSRRKLTKQKAVEQESIENQEPGTEKRGEYADIVASPPMRMTRNMRRKTLSILQNDSVMSLTGDGDDVVVTPRTPRGRTRAKKTHMRKQSIGDLIDFSTP